MIDISHRFIWKSVNIKKRKRHIKQKVIFPENDKSAESDGEYRPISS